MYTKPALTTEDAQQLVASVLAAAGARALPVTVAVVDDGGNLKALTRMDGAGLAAVGLSVDKAYTAVATGADTGDLAPLIQPGAPLHGLGHASPSPHALVTLGGGVAVRRDGIVVGGLGVAGAPSPQDDHALAGDAVATWAGGA